MSEILTGLPPNGQPPAPPWVKPAPSFNWEDELEQLKPAHAAEWEASAVAPELTRANVVSLSGREAYQALVGPFLQQKKDGSQSGGQFIGVETARELQSYGDIESGAGGWWCSGLDPLKDWRPHQDHGQLKADVPRINGEGKPLKYEAPKGLSSSVLFLRSPASTSVVTAREHGLVPPLEVVADKDGGQGAFWKWWNQETRLALGITEGGKKAGSWMTAGMACCSLPGIWNGAPKNKQTGIPELLPDFEALNLEGRRVYILFDYDSTAEKRKTSRAAAERLAGLLAERGALVTLGLVPKPPRGQKPLKGIDDWLASGKSLKAALKGQRRPKSQPILPVLRRPDVMAPADQWLSSYQPANIPSANEKRLVALGCHMGVGKTFAIEKAVQPYLQVGVPVVVIGHRRHLMEDLGEKLGLATGEDAKPGSPLRQQGLALCIDSLCPFSALRMRAADWRGAVVVMDEATATLRHMLLGTGTAVVDRLGSVLQELQELLRHAAQVIVADAHIDNATLQLIEKVMGLPEAGEKAWLINSERRPAEGRLLHVCQSKEQWLSVLTQKLSSRARVWVSTTAQRDDQACSASNLGLLAQQLWPEARVLVVDSKTVATSGHDAERLGREPNEVAAAYDVVIASPAVTAGLSVDKVRGHFEAVMVRTGGIISAKDVAQASERVRDDCPRWLFADEAAPGAQLRYGGGSHDPSEILAQRSAQAEKVLAALQAAGAALPCGSFGLWEEAWAMLCAQSNQEADAYRATIIGLLEAQGYKTKWLSAMDEEEAARGADAAKELKEQATLAVETNDQALLAAPTISDKAAQELKEKRTPLSAEEHAALDRHKHVERWGQCTKASIEADRDGLYATLRRRWWMEKGQEAGLIHDKRKAEQWAGGGPLFKPRLPERTVLQKLELLDRLGLRVLASTRALVDNSSPELQALVDKAYELEKEVRAVLGAGVLDENTRPTTIAKRLLAFVGYRLRCVTRSRQQGERVYQYVVEPVPLPDGLCFEELAAVWEQRERDEQAQHTMGALSRKLPFIRTRKDRDTAFRATPRNWMEDPEQLAELLGIPLINAGEGWRSWPQESEVVEAFS
jgi:hypothetical protein